MACFTACFRSSPSWWGKSRSRPSTERVVPNTRCRTMRSESKRPISVMKETERPRGEVGLQERAHHAERAALQEEGAVLPE